MIISGQISLRPHTTDFPQMVVNSKGNGTPKLSGKSRLVKYYSIGPDLFAQIVALIICLDNTWPMAKL